MLVKYYSSVVEYYISGTNKNEQEFSSEVGHSLKLGTRNICRKIRNSKFHIIDPLKTIFLVFTLN